MYIVQSVLNHLKNINPIIKSYVLGLMLSSSRKNCAAMAKSTGLSQKDLYAFLAGAEEHSEDIKKKLIALANETRIKKILRALCVDPTSIVKPYAKHMEKLCYDRSGATKRVEQCLVPVYIVVMDENILIPLELNFWVQKKVTGVRRYKSKIEITKQLIENAMNQGIEFDFIPLDGAFASPEMFAFFKEHGSKKFIMRIARNRCVKTADGKSVQLKNHPELKLRRNEREKPFRQSSTALFIFLLPRKEKLTMETGRSSFW